MRVLYVSPERVGSSSLRRSAGAAAAAAPGLRGRGALHLGMGPQLQVRALPRLFSTVYALEPVLAVGLHLLTGTCT